VIPFCLARSSHPKLKNSCFVVATLLFVACFFVLVHTPALHKRDVPLFSRGFPDDYLTMHVAVCHSMAILATSFASPHHTFHSFHALQGHSIGRFARLSIGSTFISIFWALGFGVGGYVSFLSGTRADVLQNYIQSGGDVPAKATWAYWILIPFCAIVGIALEVCIVLTKLSDEGLTYSFICSAGRRLPTYLSLLFTNKSEEEDREDRHPLLVADSIVTAQIWIAKNSQQSQVWCRLEEQAGHCIRSASARSDSNIQPKHDRRGDEHYRRDWWTLTVVHLACSVPLQVDCWGR
jgi:hypothetical protein